MIYLPNECSCTELKCSPKNWNRAGASIKKLWRVYYRFWDPVVDDKAHYIEIKCGINTIKNLQDRRDAVKALIADELQKLKEQGYNPISKTYIIPIDIDYEIHPDTPFIKALTQVKEKLTVSKRVLIDMQCALNTMTKAAAETRLIIMPISKISIRHLTVLMDRCGKINPRWSARRHNMYRSYLIMLFKKLTKLEAVVANPAKDIERLGEFRKLKAVLSLEQRRAINAHLKEHHYNYWCFVNLFFHSGGRRTELVQLRRSSVDMIRQKYKCVVKKGREYREVERTIKNIAVPYWEHFINACKDDNYLFGIDFKPAKKPIAPDTITRWWNRIVIKEMKINVGFYELKHLNTDEVTAILGATDAAALNAHENTDMVLKVYAVGESERQHQRLKQMNNSFA
jgi:integrase